MLSKVDDVYGVPSTVLCTVRTYMNNLPTLTNWKALVNKQMAFFFFSTKKKFLQNCHNFDTSLQWNSIALLFSLEIFYFLVKL